MMMNGTEFRMGRGTGDGMVTVVPFFVWIRGDEVFCRVVIAR